MPSCWGSTPLGMSLSHSWPWCHSGGILPVVCGCADPVWVWVTDYGSECQSGGGLEGGTQLWGSGFSSLSSHPPAVTGRHACAFLCVPVSVCACVHKCAHLLVSVSVSVSVRAYLQMQVPMRLRICTCVFTSAYVCVSVCVHV